MQKTFKYEDIEKLLSEADDLLKQTDPRSSNTWKKSNELKLNNRLKA